ncbi:MAG TPA: EamA family transporter [Candidatus Limnocylindria bacterium]|nr:EamA family transporter [Candidatus Limnocylindria bacterium]
MSQLPSPAVPNAGRAALLATVACVVAAACWATSAVIAAGAFERGMSPERLAESRVMVALVPLAAYLLLARRELLRPPRAALPALALFGVCMVAVNYAYYLAIARVPVGVAISLQYTAPVLILAGTALLLRRSPTPILWVAGAMTVAGAALVSGLLGAAGSGRLDSVGLLAGAAAAVTYAGYLVTAELAGRRGSHPVTSLFIGFCVAALLWAVVLPLWDWPFELLADPQVAWRVAAVGLVGTLLPFALTVAALRWISSALAGIATTTEPVLAAALAWVILGQELSLPQVLGAALVVAGVLAAQMARHPRPDAAPVELAP